MWRWNHIIQRLDIFCDFNDFIHFLNFSGFSDFSFLSTLTCGRLTGFGWIQEDALQIRVGGKRVPQTFFPPKVSSSNLFFETFESEANFWGTNHCAAWNLTTKPGARSSRIKTIKMRPWTLWQNEISLEALNLPAAPHRRRHPGNVTT